VRILVRQFVGHQLPISVAEVLGRIVVDGETKIKHVVS
jgi:hypothetical protein